MTTLTSRNTVQLAAGSSGTTGYYVGYIIVFTRLHKTTGKKTVQKMKIVAYDGPNKIATVDGLWLQGVVPGPETSEKKDTYEIVPGYADARVSTNPAIQSLDYITSNRYGRGLDPVKDLDLPSWLTAARSCDTKSDITVETTAGTLPTVGAVYRYPASGDMLWEGTVISVEGRYVRFTDVIGKLTNAWNSWKSFPINSIVYSENRCYISTATGTKATKPVHTTGTTGSLTYVSSLTLTKVSGTGGNLTLPANGNPIRIKSGQLYKSGYSLYDADSVDYWRYLGWDEHDQRYVTQHQTNLMIDTSLPLFDNMNSLLEHFGGMLRYNNGKYYLEIEEGETGIETTNDPRWINADNIITKIKISDEGIRSSYNSLTVAFADPGNKYEAKNISFFNSEYLKEDRNVPKKGSLSIPGITNYYNARLLAESFLTKSRFGLNISFTMDPRGSLLVAGRVIKIPYARYGWAEKEFRITDLTHNSDTTVDIVAREYDSSFYHVRPVSKPPATGLSGNTLLGNFAPPSNLIATNDISSNEGVFGIEVTWTNPTGIAAGKIFTEIHRSDSPNYFLTVTDITNSVLTINEPHLINVGSPIKVLTATGTNLTTDTYYVASIPSATTLTLATVKGGAPMVITGASGAVNWQLQTAVLIADVPFPENRFFDPYMGSTADQEEKYYWARYRVIE